MMIKNKKGALAISQILILIIGMIAISYSISFVEALPIQRRMYSPEQPDGPESNEISENYVGLRPPPNLEGKLNLFPNNKKDSVSPVPVGFTPGTSTRKVTTPPKVTIPSDYAKLKDGIKGPTKGGHYFGDITAISEKASDGSRTIMNAQGESTTLSAEKMKELGLIDDKGELIRSNLAGQINEFKANLWKNLFHALGVGLMVGGITAIFFKGKNAFRAGFIAGTAGTLTFKFLTQNKAMTPMKAGAIGAGVGIAIFLLLYRKEKTELVSYDCEPWEAPVGGNNCEKCNKQGLPCSRYQCKSLGQACELLNDEDSGEAKCVWVNRHDVEYPIIEPWEDALLIDYKYAPDNTISPPDRGVKIEYEKSTTGCVKAFTPLEFGITVDEPAKCKIDYLRKNTFDEMDFYFGGSSLFRYNHSEKLSLPGPNALNASGPVLQNDGNYELFVRCQDANGNYNTANFVFKFCVEKGPDTTPPLIVDTDISNNMPIAYNQSSLDLEVYVNEPAECKWSHRDQIYDEMENQMSCATNVFEMNAQMLYKCSTTLTGLKDRQDNVFYFRCKDQPQLKGTTKENDRNVNKESYKFTVIGTESLILTEVGPNETIKDSTDSVKVTLTAKTFAGYNKGEATCYYSDTGETDSYIAFFNTESHTHSQDLFLPEGSYKYYIKCIDLGGNSDEDSVEFYVESDSSAPIVVRAYHEGTHLKIKTNEEAECVYDTVDCNYAFDDGIGLTAVDDTDHYTNWDTNTNFYIKCRDEYGNQPIGNACSFIARPFEIFESENEE